MVLFWEIGSSPLESFRFPSLAMSTELWSPMAVVVFVTSRKRCACVGSSNPAKIAVVLRKQAGYVRSREKNTNDLKNRRLWNLLDGKAPGTIVFKRLTFV
jgi:hypothetical protein